MVDACENVSKAYDAAGRLVREGSKTYRYGYLDKVMSVTDNGSTYTYEYHADGQLAKATYGIGRAGAPRTPQTETFLWDGLALIQRGDEQFVNEPHVGGGNPVASSKGTSYFNDALGTTVGSKKDGKYSPAVLSAFGENYLTTQPPNHQTFFTGKPYVEGLGHAFLMRNYRAGLAKWQTADPMGYPDGWNQLAYCNNGVTSAVDLWGASTSTVFFEHLVHNGNKIATIVAHCNHDFNNPVFAFDNLVQLSSNPYGEAIVDSSCKNLATSEEFFTYDVAPGNTYTITIESDTYKYSFKLLSGKSPAKLATSGINKTIDWWYQVEVTTTHTFDGTNAYGELVRKTITSVERMPKVSGIHTICE